MFIVIIAASIAVVRLFDIQVIKHNYFSEQADSEHIKKFTLHADRGEIYTLDNGKPIKMVMNETVYTVWADPTQVSDKKKVIDTINKIIGGNTRKNFEKYLDYTETRYQVLATKVSRTNAERLKEEGLAGIGFDPVSQRVYPEGQLASQVLGFVDNDGNGVYGFEQYNDTSLRGKDGILKTVTDVRSIPLSIDDRNVNIPAQNGVNYVLTLDRNIQSKVESSLEEGLKKTGADQASAIVLDPMTGKVLAMANMPTYDPNYLYKVTESKLFNNNVISFPYEPASVLKTATMATAIDYGVMTPESKYYNTDSVKIGDYVINNASKGETGEVTMQHVLNWSLNTGTVEAARWLGGGEINRQSRDRLYEYYHDKFKLGELTGIELANENAGTIISPREHEGNAIRYANMTFGQGLDVTTLQTALAFSSIVNGGLYYKPSIIAGTINENGEFKEAASKGSERILKQSTSQTMRKMIYNARHAFSNYYSSDRKGYDIGGKTGTAQTIRNGRYIFEETVGTYIGYGAEKGKDPAYVIMVQVSGANQRLEGGRDAMPIFGDISNWLIDYLQLAPSE